MNPKPKTPKKIAASVIVKTSLSLDVILWSQFDLQNGYMCIPIGFYYHAVCYVYEFLEIPMQAATGFGIIRNICVQDPPPVLGTTKSGISGIK